MQLPVLKVMFQQEPVIRIVWLLPAGGPCRRYIGAQFENTYACAWHAYEIRRISVPVLHIPANRFLYGTKIVSLLNKPNKHFVYYE